MSNTDDPRMSDYLFHRATVDAHAPIGRHESMLEELAVHYTDQPGAERRRVFKARPGEPSRWACRKGEEFDAYWRGKPVRLRVESIEDGIVSGDVLKHPG